MVYINTDQAVPETADQQHNEKNRFMYMNLEKDLTIGCHAARIRKHVKSVCACSSVDRVPGYEPVGRRFESCQARQKDMAFHQGRPCLF